MATLNESEIRVYIKIRVLLSATATDIHKDLVAVCGDQAPSYRTVAKWTQRYREGRESTEDDPRSGHPVTTITQVNVAAVRHQLEEDNRLTIDELAASTALSHGTVYTILHDHLGVRKICARWVPHVLTEAQKVSRVETAASLLRKFRAWGDNVMHDIATGDETWVHLFEPPRKAQNMAWVKKGDPRPTVAKREKSSEKVLYTFFFTKDGILLQLPTPHGRTITGKYYAQSVLPLVVKAFQEKRPDRKLHIHHDNAPAHSSGIVSEFLEENNIAVVPHPPYSPDLAPCDFWLFPILKDLLRGTHYASRNAVGSAIFQCIQRIPQSDFVACFQQWKHRLQRCVDLGGMYVERVE
jgi:histone-lysine N-methyltransferase SETMAR